MERYDRLETLKWKLFKKANNKFVLFTISDCYLLANLIENEQEQIKKNRLKSCPFCGGSDLGIFSIASDIGKNNYDFFVSCKTCFTKTPMCKNKEEAIKIWNRE